jgi:hypothetical protein
MLDTITRKHLFAKNSGKVIARIVVVQLITMYLVIRMIHTGKYLVAGVGFYGMRIDHRLQPTGWGVLLIIKIREGGEEYALPFFGSI